MQSTHQSCSGPACPFSSRLFFACFFLLVAWLEKTKQKANPKSKKRNSQFVPSYFSPAPFFSGLLPCPHVHRVHFPFSLSSLRLSSSRLSQTQQFPAVVFFWAVAFCFMLVPSLYTVMVAIAVFSCLF